MDGQLVNPLRTFAILESRLLGVNMLTCGLLSDDISRSVFAFRKMVMVTGFPLLLLYAIGVFAVLSVPCWLVGATMPLAAKVFQRNLSLKNAR